MKTFHVIVKKITNAQRLFADPTMLPTTGQHSIVHNYFLLLLEVGDKLSPQTKFAFFSNGLQCFFITGENEPLFIDLFCQIQQTYHRLNRFARRIKYNKAKINAKTDFYLNPLDPHSRHVFCFFDGRVKYLFHIHDLYKIIVKSLSHSNQFYESPMSIKNPYTNLPFAKSTLYSIYFFMRFTCNMECSLFFLFFKCNFNMSDFLYYHEYELREKAIDNYVQQSNKTQILDMIDFYNDDTRLLKKHIQIHDDFPEDTLVSIFKPYFKLYIQSKYSLIRHIRNRSFHSFFQKMEDFQEFNPRFGEKNYKIVSVHNPTTPFCNKVYREDVFNTKHIPFYDNHTDTKYFLLDHAI
jgi:hypothetical protein